MPTEWILNTINMRFQFNRPKYVGRTSELIRRCAPKTLADWEKYYYAHVHPPEHLRDLGRRLYLKVSEVARAELDSISEDDCMEFVKRLVIDRTYAGYVREKETIYGQLQNALGVKIEPAPDEWDRRYNVDFFIKIGSAFVGIQVKPESFPSSPDAAKWLEVQKKTHEKFSARFGGKVFTVVSAGTKRDKRIWNPEVVDEIRSEIARLRLCGHA